MDDNDGQNMVVGTIAKAYNVASMKSWHLHLTS